MDHPEAISPVVPQLDYAPQSSVGDLALSRKDGTTTITIKPGLRRVLRILWGALLAALISFAGLMYVLFFRSGSVNPTPFIIVICIGTLMSAIGFFKPMVITLSMQKWTATSRGLEFTGRRPTDILREVYPLQWIADLRIESVRLKNHALKTRGLVLVRPDGNKVLIMRGTNSELEFACQAFREVLGLQVDPLGEREYPRTRRMSRISQRLVQGGVVLTLYPTLCGVDGGLLILLSIPLLAGLDTMLGRYNPGLDVPPIFSALGLLRIFIWCLLVDGILLAVKFKIRRAITLMWTPEGLGLHERSLFNPCTERWPADQVESVFTQAVSNRRANLLLKLIDGTVQPLITKEATAEVENANLILNTAISRTRRK